MWVQSPQQTILLVNVATVFAQWLTTQDFIESTFLSLLIIKPISCWSKGIFLLVAATLFGWSEPSNPPCAAHQIRSNDEIPRRTLDGWQRHLSDAGENMENPQNGGSKDSIIGEI